MSAPGPAVEAFGVEGIGEVNAGDDVAVLVLHALRAQGRPLADGDIVVVSSKVVSKARGLAIPANSREAAIDAETVRVVAERRTPRGTTRIVQARSGPVLAAAGVDASNVAPGTVLVLPPDPDDAARELRTRLSTVSGQRVGVLITDTMGRPWRDGQVDAAIGAAGTMVSDDLRGGSDSYGNPLEVTVRALVDEIAALADLVKGKLDGVPVAIVRGLDRLVTDEDGPGARSLLRGPDEDWFRLGHVEAVRSALGVPPGSAGVPAQPAPGGPVRDRLERAISVALASPQWPVRPGVTRPWVQVSVVDEQDESISAQGVSIMVSMGLTDGYTLHEVAALGALAQRVLAAAWAEGLDAALVPRWHTAPTELAVRAVLRAQ